MDDLKYYENIKDSIHIELLSLLNNLEIDVSNNGIIYYKTIKSIHYPILFFENSISDSYYKVSYNDIWTILENKYGMCYNEIEIILRDIISTIFNNITGIPEPNNDITIFNKDVNDFSLI